MEQLHQLFQDVAGERRLGISCKEDPKKMLISDVIDEDGRMSQYCSDRHIDQEVRNRFESSRVLFLGYVTSLSSRAKIEPFDSYAFVIRDENVESYLCIRVYRCLNLVQIYDLLADEPLSEWGLELIDRIQDFIEELHPNKNVEIQKRNRMKSLFPI